MASPERELISAVINYAALDEVINSRIDDGYFEDDEHSRVWAWMLEHWTRYSRVPDRSSLRANFPSWKVLETPEPIEYYVDVLRDRRKYTITSEAVVNATEALREEDTDGAIAALGAAVQEALSTASTLQTDILTQTGEERLERYIDWSKNPGRLRGMATGFRAIDRATRGIQPEQYIVVAGAQKSGKAQSLDTPIATPNGWSKFGDLQVGDYVYGSDGRPTRVVALSPVWDDLDTYEVTFSDDSKFVVAGSHEWTLDRRRLSGRNPRESVTLETRDLAEHMIGGSERHPHRRLSAPPWSGLVGEHADLPIAPYTLGVWLGDGAAAGGVVSKPDEELFVLVQEDGFEVSRPRPSAETRTVYGLVTMLRRELLLGDKHIPAAYLRSSRDQRLALLQGLMDTDGSINPDDGTCEFSSSTPALAEGFGELLTSLGIVWRSKSRVPKCNGKECKLSWRFHFTPTFRVFRLNRKLQHQRPRSGDRFRRRFLTGVRQLEHPVPLRCIQVDAADGLYLTGHKMIPTHNSTILMQMAINLNEEADVSVLFVSFEMSAEEQGARHDSLRAHVSHSRILDGRMTAKDRRRLTDMTEDLKEYKDFTLSTDIASMTTVSGVRAQVEAIKPDVLIIDGVYLMEDELGEPSGSPRALTNISRNLKRLAQSTKVPVIVSTQALEHKMTKKSGVTAHSIGYASAFSQDCNVLLGIDRDEDTETTILKVVLSRSGPKATSEIRIDWDNGKIEEFEPAGDGDDDDASTSY